MNEDTTYSFGVFIALFRVIFAADSHFDSHLIASSRLKMFPSNGVAQFSPLFTKKAQTSESNSSDRLRELPVICAIIPGLSSGEGRG
jgi:hypothetical protein